MKRILKKQSPFFNLRVFPSCRFLITAFSFLGVAFTNHNTHADCVEPPPNMVAWWPADDTPRDIVGSHHATLHGTANYTPAEVLDGFSFDGSTGCYFSAPFALTNSAFSVDLWVKATSAAQAAYTSVISSSFPGRYDDTWQIDFDTFGNYRGQFGNDALILDIGPVSTTAFQHIAVTYEPAIGGGAVVSSYLDGVLTDTDTWTGMPIVFESVKRLPQELHLTLFPHGKTADVQGSLAQL